uniref:Uncharacterized protein n=1 Tax=Tanacetum cinerariifolium TaxID=118510 RepID=A0A699HJ38_TANCI|nr:hypothetical protein [Tanacetum cinerariifolium]
MDSMIPIRQKNSLVEYMILSGADNHPPMLDKGLYDYWKCRMELYVQNREHKRMILESVKHGPLIWPTIEENWVTKTKKYVELSATGKIQADSDLKQFQVNTSFLNSLPPEWSKFVTDVKIEKDLHTTNFDQLHAYLQQHELYANKVRIMLPVFKQGDDPIDVINKMMSFLSTVVTSRFPSTNNQQRNSSNPRQQATIHVGMVTIQPVQGRQTLFAAGMSGTRANISVIGGSNSGQGNGKVLNEEELEFLANPGIAKGPVTQTVITHNAAYQADDMDAYDSDCDDFSTANVVLMANLSSYILDVLPRG